MRTRTGNMYYCTLFASSRIGVVESIASGCEQRSTETSSAVAMLIGVVSGCEQRSTETSSVVARRVAGSALPASDMKGLFRP